MHTGCNIKAGNWPRRQSKQRLRSTLNHQRALPEAAPKRVSGMLAPSLLDVPETPDVLWGLVLWLNQASSGCGSWGHDLGLLRGLPPNLHSPIHQPPVDPASLHISISFSNFWGDF